MIKNLIHYDDLYLKINILKNVLHPIPNAQESDFWPFFAYSGQQDKNFKIREFWRGSNCPKHQ